VARERLVTLLLPGDAYELLCREALRRGLSLSELVEEVVRAALRGRSIRMSLDGSGWVLAFVRLPEELYGEVLRKAAVAGLSAPKMIAGIVTHWARSPREG